MAAKAISGRFQQVRDILNAAAGDSDADYGGIGRFWDKDHETLLNAAVHGEAMIAPPNCCSSERGGETDNRPGRGESSGLVKGLRGEAPFDGSRFPPLPWGGARVGTDEIAFISEWIDDGCPDQDLGRFQLGPLESETPARIRIEDLAEFDFVEGVAARPPPREGMPRQRANLDCLSGAQLADLRRAFRAAYRLNRWPEDRRSFNNQSLVHQNHCQHGWERFLPWHRAYIYEFEQNLQDLVPGLMLAYWDWTMPQYCPDRPEKGSVIPKAYQAFLTEDAADKMLCGLDPKPSAGQRSRFQAMATDAMHFKRQLDFFRYVIYEVGYTEVTPSPGDANRQCMIDALLESNALWYPLRYPAEYIGGGTINEAIHYHYPTSEDMAQIMALNNFRDFGGGSIYNASFGFVDQNPHNTMHIWTGGQNPVIDATTGKPLPSYPPIADPNSAPQESPAADQANAGDNRSLAVNAAGRRFHKRSDLYSQPAMGDMFSNLTASFDPIFWPIHANVDRVWCEWQKENPNAAPSGLDAILTPWSYTVRDTLDIDRFGYEYVRNTFSIPVGLEAPIGRFVSKPIAINKKTRQFRKAEVRLHWVPQLVRSCFVRVFLNEPGANASTPVRCNPHFGGYAAIFGHGSCYGGPAHCDLPPPRAREYDRRPRHHNTPRNHRIDVTDCARTLLEDCDQLQLTLLVVGVDYREERDLLRLDSVSLDFLD